MHLQEREFRSSASSNGDIAISGMACIFPGAPNLSTYWQNICSKVDAVSDPPQDWGDELFFDPNSQENDRIYCKRGGYLGDLASFDPLSYGVMPSSVDGSEPDHFLALRVAHEALDDAAFDRRAIDKNRVAVILGRGTYVNRGYTGLVQHGLVLDQTIRLLRQLHPEHSEQELNSIKHELKAALPPFNAEVAPGLVPNIVTGRIANRLDFMGPNYTVDAACASSLVAVELGMKELRSGNCDVAIVGGVHASTPPPILMIFCQLNALSRKGRIRPFDKDADGTLLGEGVGIIVLKRLEDAERAHDRIYAVLKGIGIASDGRALGLLAPRVDGEELALRRAYLEAAVSPESIELIEAHGTGTPVGDATELEALTKVFACSDSNRPPWCALGSVKSMISHLIPAAGIAGLIKTALALHHKILPPTLHVDQANAKLHAAGTPFYLSTETRPWIHGAETPRRAGVNAFGFGGINAHAIVEEYTRLKPESFSNFNRQWATELCVFQAESRADLLAQRKASLQYLAEHQDAELRDVAYTLNSRLRAGSTRLALVASSTLDLKEKFEYATKRLQDPSCQRIKEVSGIYFFQEPLCRKGKLAFVFPGEGSQYTNMLSDLCMHFPEAREWFDVVDRAFAAQKSKVLPSQVIFPPPSFRTGNKDEQLWQMDVGAESVFAANQALFAVLKRLHLRPDGVVGHSTGEYSALLAAGILQFDNQEQVSQSILALHTVYQKFVTEEGIPQAILLAVGGADPAFVASLVQNSGGELCLAMDNCPHQVILSGSRSAIDRAAEQLRGKGAICSQLPFQRAYHTPQFHTFCERLIDHFQNLPVQSPTCEIYSCVTSSPYPHAPAAIRKLAVEQWERPVRFRQTIEAMYAAGFSVFVEVGPRGNLTAFVNDILAGRPFLAVSADLARRSGTTQLNHMLGLLVAHGAELYLQHLYTSRAAQLLTEAKAVQNGTAPPRSVRLAMGLAPLRLKTNGPNPQSTVSSGGASVTPTAKATSSTAKTDRAGLQIVARSAAHPAARSLDLTHFRESAEPPPSADVATVAEDLRAQVMHEHLQTMERFLATQKGVMRAFLRTATAGSEISCHRAQTVSRPVPEEVSEPVEAEKTQCSSDRHTASSETEPIEQETPPNDKTAKLSAPEFASIQQTFLSVLAERTGYPLGMLGPMLNLEADLGIDSIKRIEILAALQRIAGVPRGEDMDTVSKLKTIEQVVDFLSSASQPMAASSTTVQPPASNFPLLGTVSAPIQGKHLEATIEFTLTEHLFLRDHTLGAGVSESDPELRGLAVVPLTFSMEILAEAAAALCPGKVVTRMEKIRAHRWIKLDADPTILKVVAKISQDLPSACEVRIVSAGEGDAMDASRPPITVVEAIVVVSDDYPPPPAAGEFVLSSPRLSKWKHSELYSGYMFHGPTLRAVSEMRLFGNDGAVAALAALPSKGLLRSNSNPEFLIAPVLLDAAGQVVAFWLEEFAQDAFHIFPFELEALEIYSPACEQDEQIECRARIGTFGDMQLRSDIDLIREEKVAIRMSGWRDKRFHLPESFYRLRISPKDTFLTHLWDVQISTEACGDLCCARLDDLAPAFLESSSHIWQSVLAHLVLCAEERRNWLALTGTESRRLHWLLGRVAAKDAVRMLLSKKYGWEIYPADIHITHEADGRPGVRLLMEKEFPHPICISIAHIEGVAMAAAAERTNIDSIGVDIERIGRVGADFHDLAFVREERRLIADMGSSQSEEWSLRLWCAKEAVAKALGSSVPASPTELVAQRIEPETGRVELAFSPESAKRRGTNGNRYLACTLRERDLVAATSILPRSR